MSAQRQTGTVVKWDAFKGYGYINTDGISDIFVHYSAITDEDKDLHVGQLVEFDFFMGPRGPQAANVTKEVEET